MSTSPATNSKPFTLYTSKLCPYAHRTELALHESKQFGNVERVQIDLMKPRDAWFVENYNPSGQVPVLVVNESKTIVPESAVIANYVAEVYPESGLLPDDPLQRARVRYVIERALQLILRNYPSAVFKREAEGVNALYSSLEQVEKLFNSISATGPFIFGDKLTLADIATAPFLARIVAVTDPNLGLISSELISPSIPERVQTELPRLREFLDAVKARPSWKDTFDEEHVRTITKQKALEIKA
ncbi:unnamed protein product [Tilletia controversa]|uniref:Uncharacterized protein n=3 Tax=Tilletia TaxID=13289 RepID=A0A8X7MZJ1_9BASI|nr:hypothetical protein CF336_g133 [Tilletia laevis]KAE8206110.1 hypothetical protein CF328_g114 [Tilletia controversa]KAE8265686.1 hypothetical protein A4X03_0g98 [Tilletia caries]KAE8208834.1 hypothetical protein CF335_g107 [Tilletia laevis]KAE8255805.1 hypothetical protein A4X06_0g247 [Tilletia controversa]